MRRFAGRSPRRRRRSWKVKRRGDACRWRKLAGGEGRGEAASACDGIGPANRSRERSERVAKVGGEEGIRTLGTAFRPYNGLANRRLQPLGHLTADCKCNRNGHLANPHFSRVKAFELPQSRISSEIPRSIAVGVRTVSGTCHSDSAGMTCSVGADLTRRKRRPSPLVCRQQAYRISTTSRGTTNRQQTRSESCHRRQFHEPIERRDDRLEQPVGRRRAAVVDNVEPDLFEILLSEHRQPKPSSWLSRLTR